MDRKHAFIMMIQEKWWNGFLDRLRQGKQTHSYVQKGSAAPELASILMFYVTKPTGQVEGYADFIGRRVGDSDDLWELYGHESVLKSKEEFINFTEDRQQVTFIRFKNLQKTVKPIPLNDLLLILGVSRLSRKGFYVEREMAEKLVGLMQ